MTKHTGLEKRIANILVSSMPLLLQGHECPHYG
ncbi:hypothetical protein GGR60_003384 [Xanthomonas arboricola]|nr:hypothetical protein [Xanthomonas euroxanthea]